MMEVEPTFFEMYIIPNEMIKLKNCGSNVCVTSTRHQHVIFTFVILWNIQACSGVGIKFLTKLN
jgi:hypothetical protein